MPWSSVPIVMSSGKKYWAQLCWLVVTYITLTGNYLWGQNQRWYPSTCSSSPRVELMWHHALPLLRNTAVTSKLYVNLFMCNLTFLCVAELLHICNLTDLTEISWLKIGLQINRIFSYSQSSTVSLKVLCLCTDCTTRRLKSQPDWTHCWV